MPGPIESFFSCGSTYSYLSVTRIEQITAGVDVRWRPFFARAIMTEQNNRPFLGKPVKTKSLSVNKGVHCSSVRDDARDGGKRWRKHGWNHG